MRTIYRFTSGLALMALFGAVPRPANAQVASRPGLTLDGAKAAAAAATAEARRLGAAGAVAVVDEGGNLVYLERLENTFPAATSVAIEKARTAAQFRRPTRDFENAIAKGRTSLVAVDVMTPLQGGVPITIDGQVVGAIGISGAMSAQQDDDIAALAAQVSMRGAGAPAQTAAGAQTPGDGNVVFTSAAETAAAFAKGVPLFETGAYKIHASRREAAGMAEVHTRDTDIVYVLDGKATFVTGGAMVDGRTTAPDEIRGARIDGGTTRTLEKGDLVVVPNGVPHWFKDVKAPFLYYVVKVTAPMGGTR